MSLHITASQARAQAISVSELNQVYIKIKKAVELGQFYIEASSLTSATINALRANQYTVDYFEVDRRDDSGGSDRQWKYWRISWE